MPEDLLKYGLIPEFVGRLPVVVTLSALDGRGPGPRPDGAQERHHPPVPELPLARQGRAGVHAGRAPRGRGAWRWTARPVPAALRSILEDSLLDVMYDIPERTEVRKCIITEETIRQRRMPLLLTKSEVESGVDENNYAEWLAERGELPDRRLRFSVVGAGRRPSRPGPRLDRLPERLGEVHGCPAGSLADLLAAAEPVGQHHRVRGEVADRGEQRPLAGRERDVAVLATLEPERARHAAAARIEHAVVGVHPLER